MGWNEINCVSRCFQRSDLKLHSYFEYEPVLCRPLNILFHILFWRKLEKQRLFACFFVFLCFVLCCSSEYCIVAMTNANVGDDFVIVFCVLYCVFVCEYCIVVREKANVGDNFLSSFLCSIFLCLAVNIALLWGKRQM